MTPNDNLLLQISDLAREEIEAVSGKTSSELKYHRIELSNKFTTLSNRIKDLDIKLSKNLAVVTKDISQIKKDISKIQKDVASHANYFDREYLELKNQVKSLEDRAQLKPLFR